MPNGRAPAAGELFHSPSHAQTLQKIAESEGEAFYRGRLADQIAVFAREHSAALCESDLAEHVNDWPSTIAQEFAGATLHELLPTGKALQP